MNRLKKFPIKMWIGVVGSLALLACLTYFFVHRARSTKQVAKPNRLYWFIPDGLRADPEIFNIFRWAEEGKLPNIKKMMASGAYGYSIPIFPSHTPSNYATLLTGLLPARHGVTDGPIRLSGHPLQFISQTGFSSSAKLVDPLWYTLERAGVASTLLSVPGSTPPEVHSGQTIKGRWGGWGSEFPSVIFQSSDDLIFGEKVGRNDRLFMVGKPLTKFLHTKTPRGWSVPLPKSFSPLREVDLSDSNSALYGLLTDSRDDGRENYDRLYIAKSRGAILFHVDVGAWSDWFPVDLSQGEPGAGSQIPLLARIKVIKLGRRDFFRIRVLYEGLNPSLVEPSTLAADLRRDVGPMVDFPDNYPPQLIYFDEDRATFLEESEMSFAWHQKAASALLHSARQDVMIHSIYSPNQMLTSRWWLPFLDPDSRQYHDVGETKRQKIWDETLAMYQRVDLILGEAMSQLGADSYIVLSSDHGAVPLNYEVRLNNYFAKKGWLRFVYNIKSRTYEVDWRKTKVVFLMMNHIYINPEGLDGPYQPAAGSAYEKLRREVEDAMRILADERGERPLDQIFTRERAGEIGLGPDRVGDLIIVNKLGFNWVEDVSRDHKLFVESLKGGYKQAVDPAVHGLWTPFIIMGPGIKKNFKIEKAISHLDQYPTILKALGVEAPYKTEHGVLEQIFIQNR